MIQIGSVTVKIQLICASHHVMGPGKADLLEAIEREGSISAASRALGMSYHKCRRLADSMNRSWSGPLIESRQAGVRRRQSAGLTELGRQVLSNFRALENAVGTTAAANVQFADLARRLNP